ncbi:zinc finger CCHC domain-containing protein 8 homolog isoform X2 [Bacillus rossius redtenbacheri]|uniref:zinc finger CCHC domain-containing protein 8 homolog isoform X2 n=1 Tax=Bacillus rossius redtenbacheri TaxID=93214 RepID=UPI002FDDC95B
MFFDGCDSTSMSGGTSTNEENDSDFSERFVTENSSQDFGSASCSKSGEADVTEKDFAVQPVNFREENERNLTEDSRPLFSIKFRNEIIARKYREAVKKFLKELIAKHDPAAENGDISDLELDIWEEGSGEGSPPAPGTGEQVAASPGGPGPGPDDKPRDPLPVPDDANLFVIDKRPKVTDGRDVPFYRQRRSFKTLIESEGKPEEASASAASPRRMTCFNCHGSHSLRDCPKPRNQLNINRNRRDFVAATGKQTGRYHVEEDQKYSSFAPGRISDDLRRALGLRRNELPRHVYRMRQLGYPPGWLAAARVHHSGISVFDEQGKEVLHSDDEEGEVISEEMKVKYDPSKIIEFPGFNVQPPPGTRDDSRYYRCPPMTEEQSLEAMLGQLGPTYMGGKRRRKKAVMAVQTATPQSDLDLTAADMDMDDAPAGVSLPLLPSDDNCRFIPPLPIETPPHAPPPPPSETPPRPPAPSSMESDSEGADSRSLGVSSPLSTGHSSVSSPRPQSPSLSELEGKKALLLAELEDGASSDTAPRPPVGSTTHHTPLSLGKVKNVNLGTPVLQSSSPFKRLPEPVKFSKDVSDVINFENLPESTGAYGKISGVIEKVRKVMSSEQV